jgi:chemotaxis methyl-accepting protein methylase
METLGIHELEKYTRLVRRDPFERAVLDSLLRLTITRFYRNSWLWSDLGSLIPEVQKTLEQGEVLRIWSAGCGGGEEPFSLALLLDDLVHAGLLSNAWSILGTDSDQASLARARAGEYSWGSVREIPGNLLDRWFEERNGLWVLSDVIRSMVEIRHHDLINTDPPGRYHVVFLRNSVLTYNTDEIQRKVLGRIRGCLLDPGYLVIGRTEKIPDGTGFEEVSKNVYKIIRL